MRQRRQQMKTNGHRYGTGTEPELINANMAGNIDQREATERAVHHINSDKEFKLKYIVPSVFFIGAGAFGSVFRVVTRASGKPDNPRYPKQLIGDLQLISNTNRCTRDSLLDSFRDKSCLDLVAVKFEHLTYDDVELNAPGTVNLIREYSILRHLFRKQETRYAPVGFPLPIEFSYVGGEKLTSDFNTLIVTDVHARHSKFAEAFVDNDDFGVINDANKARLTSYATMELVGPNLDDWKSFFMDTHGSEGKLHFSLETTFKLMDQLLCRLIFMHRKNMVHLDLKPDNICMGIGRMTNTVYLVDYGLSRYVTDVSPPISVGSRRYMSTGMFDLKPSNYMMDIESWFYILIVLLTDYIPWSDEALGPQIEDKDATGGARDEILAGMVIKTKKSFWGDDGNFNKSLLEDLDRRMFECHGDVVPDAGSMFLEIYEHVKRMRNDFYSVGQTRMNAEMKDEESDLFKRYRSLRKLLLYPYDCDFSGSEYFKGDKDLVRRQSERRKRQPMLTYVTGGTNWHWDWDVWYDEGPLNKNSIKQVERRRRRSRSHSRRRRQRR